MNASSAVAPVVALPIERDGNAPRNVRRAIAAAFPEGGMMIEDVTLVASELVTNVLRHTKGTGAICVWDSDPLLLTVSDSSDLPVMAESAVHGGRGLSIVSELAGEWGTTYTTKGKTIWVQFPKRAAPDPSTIRSRSQPDAVRDAFDAFMTDRRPAKVIVTTTDGQEQAGCLVDMHSACGRDPAQYAVWLRRSNHTFTVARLAPSLALHFLGDDDAALAELFASSSTAIDKFARCSWSRGPHGVPLIERLPRRLVLHDVTVWESTGDHCCVVGTVTDVTFEPASARAVRPAGSDRSTG